MAYAESVYSTIAGARASAIGAYTHILREASATVRPTIPGNAKASESGTGNSYSSHAFFVFLPVASGSWALFKSVSVMPTLEQLRPDGASYPEKRPIICDICKSRDYVEQLIRCYISTFKEGYKNCHVIKRSLSDCITGCLNEPDCYTHRNSHQRRIKEKSIKKGTYSLTKMFDEHGSEDIKDFEQLFDLVEEYIGKINGLSRCTIYDTALRLIWIHDKAYEHLLPEKMVYLHRGALTGARALWDIDSTRSQIFGENKKYYSADYPKSEHAVPRETFIGPFNKTYGKIKLNAYDIEDFLCVFHNELLNYALNYRRYQLEKK